jgi:hypothetical protein
MIESGIDFCFPESYNVVKFDETSFYCLFKSSMPNGKGIDFFADSEDKLLMIEVKNCLNYESENNWRTQVGTIKISSNSIEESFDIEIAKKVQSTIACTVGANTGYEYSIADDLKLLFKAISSNKFAKGTKTIEVILYLDGNFESRTRSKNMIMKRIQEKIKEKLKWLNCNVRVVDYNTHGNKYFTTEYVHISG